MALLELDGLRTFFKTRAGEVHAVDGVSFSLERGRTLGIVGGSIRFEDRELTRMSQRELEDIRGRQIAMIFQDPMTSLNPTLTIGTQLSETIRRHYDVSQKQADKKAIELLEKV